MRVMLEMVTILMVVVAFEVLSRWPVLSPRPPRTADHDVLDVVGGRTSYDLLSPDGRLVLVQPSRTCSFVGGARPPSPGDVRRGGGHLHDALRWRYVALVWGNALVGFVATDRVKSRGYRLLDPCPIATDDAASATRRRSRADRAAMAASVAALHTDVDASPGELVFHDSRAASTPRRSTATLTHSRAPVVVGAASGARRTPTSSHFIPTPTPTSAAPCTMTLSRALSARRSPATVTRSRAPLVVGLRVVRGARRRQRLTCRAREEMAT